MNRGNASELRAPPDLSDSNRQKSSITLKMAISDEGSQVSESREEDEQDEEDQQEGEMRERLAGRYKTKSQKKKFVLATRLDIYRLQKDQYLNQNQHMRQQSGRNKQGSITGSLGANNKSSFAPNQQGRDGGYAPIGHRGSAPPNTIPVTNEVKQKNIFDRTQQQQQVWAEFHEYEQGPKYQANGSVVARSIVGKTQWFNKEQQERERKNLFANAKGTLARFLVTPTRSVVKGNSQVYTESNALNTILNNFKQKQGLNEQGSKMNSNSQLAQNNRGETQHGAQSLGGSASNQEVLKRGITSSTSAANLMLKKKKDNETDEFFIQRSKQQLLQEADQCQKRSQTSQTVKRQYLQKLPLAETNELTRQERVIQNFCSQQEQWKQWGQTVSEKIQRKSNQIPIIEQNERQRAKQEMREALELIKNDSERLGQRYWYLSLRHEFSDRVIKMRDQTVIGDKNVYTEPQPKDPHAAALEKYHHDPFSNFSTVSCIDPLKVIEIVRKPRTAQKSAGTLQQYFVGSGREITQSAAKTGTTFFSTTMGKWQSSSSMSQLVQTASMASCLQENVPSGEEIAARKFVHLQRKLQNRMVLAEEEDIEDLMIQGENVYKKEIQHLQQDGRPPTQIYKRLIDKDNPPPDEEGKTGENKIIVQDTQDREETYAQNYDILELNKRGLHFYPRVFEETHKLETPADWRKRKQEQIEEQLREEGNQQKHQRQGIVMLTSSQANIQN